MQQIRFSDVEFASQHKRTGRAYGRTKLAGEQALLATNPTKTEKYTLPAKWPKNSRLDTGELSDARGLEIPQRSTYADRTIDQLIKADI